MAKFVSIFCLGGALTVQALVLTRSNDAKDDDKVCPGTSPLTEWNCEPMLYMPSKEVVSCACEKCGSTSILNLIYKDMFEEEWDNDKCNTDVHIVDAKCWNNLWEKVDSEETFRNSYTHAVIRDPKERLVSSWKSKYACDGDKYGQNELEQGLRMGRNRVLREHAGFPTDNSCMELKEFAQALAAVAQNGKEALLDQHVVPQHMWCFGEHKPSEWDKVVSLSEPGSLQDLAEHLGMEHNEVEHDHESTAKIVIDQDTADALDIATKEDYNVLGPYLHVASRVTVGAEVLVHDVQ